MHTFRVKTNSQKILYKNELLFSSCSVFCLPSTYGIKKCLFTFALFFFFCCYVYYYYYCLGAERGGWWGTFLNGQYLFSLKTQKISEMVKMVSINFIVVMFVFFPILPWLLRWYVLLFSWCGGSELKLSWLLWAIWLMFFG